MLDLDVLPEAQKMASAVRPSFGAVKQRTLKTSIGCTGVGLHSGSKVTMILHPAEANSGIRFRRTDIAGAGAVIPARWDSVSDTRLNTCVADAGGIGVRTIEHLMSALCGMGIDNVLIDISGPEVPVMDGSAAPFLFLIECAGVVEQAAPRRVVKVLKPVVVRDGDKVAMLTPAHSFSVHMEIDFPVPTIGRQECLLSVHPGAFKSEVSRARTFGFEQEVAAMRAAGLGRGGSLDNAVVIASDGQGVLNEEGLRYDDEFVRHKALDAVGDLYLAGGHILGAFHGVRTGHALNNMLLRALFADDSAWTLTTVSAHDAHRTAELPMASTRLIAASA
ncbi:MAG TPA: UDP-3-O-acyl-N-acetylglucosamine deacetylase [Candidatus Sulfotelmatobacter sp.]|jgi:UDP-3-O-[3-hydroxymyristoyl] N-acetylglucosamine deacetylase|nr:UDP-3-O-acyl-N-acetylglucosamine deacetylase [Candidatus Sulfotelmatobacter sp.]